MLLVYDYLINIHIGLIIGMFVVLSYMMNRHFSKIFRPFYDVHTDRYNYVESRDYLPFIIISK